MKGIFFLESKEFSRINLQELQEFFEIFEFVE